MAAEKNAIRAARIVKEAVEDIIADKRASAKPEAGRLEESSIILTGVVLPGEVTRVDGWKRNALQRLTLFEERIYHYPQDFQPVSVKKKTSDLVLFEGAQANLQGLHGSFGLQNVPTD